MELRHGSPQGGPAHFHGLDTGARTTAFRSRSGAGLVALLAADSSIRPSCRPKRAALLRSGIPVLRSVRWGCGRPGADLGRDRPPSRCRWDRWRVPAPAPLPKRAPGRDSTAARHRKGSDAPAKDRQQTGQREDAFFTLGGGVQALTIGSPSATGVTAYRNCTKAVVVMSQRQRITGYFRWLPARSGKAT